MKQFLVVLTSLLLLIVGAASPVVVAKIRDCSVVVTSKVETDHTIYEISGDRFAAGEQIRVEALNRRTNQGYVFFVTPTTTSFSGIIIGRDADGFFYRVPPGGWKVEAKGTACKAKTEFAVSGLPNGVWGGEQVFEPNGRRPARLETFDEGAKLLSFCSSGTIDGPLLPDGNGKFGAGGTLTLDGPGPSRRFESARYTGQTDGNTMTLTVTVDGSFPITLTFNLTLGQRADPGPCPFR
jgi:hypothetical protein